MATIGMSAGTFTGRFHKKSKIMMQLSPSAETCTLQASQVPPLPCYSLSLHFQKSSFSPLKSPPSSPSVALSVLSSQNAIHRSLHLQEPTLHLKMQLNSFSFPKTSVTTLTSSHTHIQSKHSRICQCSSDINSIFAVGQFVYFPSNEVKMTHDTRLIDSVDCDECHERQRN